MRKPYRRKKRSNLVPIVLALGGVKGDRPGDDALIAMSDATCTALQLTNFWQDVRRDLLERDRIYMPSTDCGVSPAQLREWAGRTTGPGSGPGGSARLLRTYYGERPLHEVLDYIGHNPRPERRVA